MCESRDPHFLCPRLCGCIYVNNCAFVSVFICPFKYISLFYVCVCALPGTELSCRATEHHTDKIRADPAHGS